MKLYDSSELMNSSGRLKVGEKLAFVYPGFEIHVELIDDTTFLAEFRSVEGAQKSIFCSRPVLKRVIDYLLHQDMLA